ncbi:serine/threonine protein phosphatase [Leptospira congkakensis]|uniref:Serine/threonine protein phosphatase n=1 Tax=Leptospira congkakensis TaxID=2484932 RepID=A0A4Z1ABD4_9LEPT|nr:SpoIIE family protein phosphatase [Leptospira congkakensis]TGL87211.1 serine/threonine protein phosphatase [Leptospira congkakensis]TGL96778.1 serine/threonine protein phosphatase [Leptospira congkakensis]TGL97628.1 serine/threonine protein phosphatase [Leptospira congkakensis]
MKKTKLYFFLFFSSFFLNSSLWSFPLSIEESKNYRDIGKYFEYVIVPENESSLDRILREDTVWRPNPKATISFPRIKDPVWIKITLIHYGNLPHTFFLHFSSPVVDVFELHSQVKGNWITQVSGEQVLQRNKPLYSHIPAFPITLSPDETRTLYVKINSANPIFNFVSIYNSRSFISFSKKQDIFFAAYFGAGFMMFLFSIFLAHTLRYRKFFYYFFYLATVLLINSFSTGFMQYIEIGNTHTWKNFLFPITIYLTSVFGLLFTIEFLETEKNFPKVTKLTKGFILLFISLIFSIFFLELRNFIQLGVFLVIIPILLTLTISIMAFFKSKRKLEVILFLFAFGSILIGGALNTLTVQGWIKPIHLSSYSLALGSAIEVFFLSMALVLKVSDYRKATEEKQELDLQLKIAQKLQNGLLPQKRTHANGHALGFRYSPASDIGGDFVQIIVKENEIGLFLCDVSGHGIPAAMIASMTKVSLQIWDDSLDKPVYAAERIRLSLLSSLAGHFLSAFFVYINQKDKILKIANAGHHPMIYLDRNGNIEHITSTGRAINEYVESGMIEKTLTLPDSGTLILYTDGVIEARKANDGELFGEDRFYHLLQTLATKNPQSICDQVIIEVEKFQKSKRSDDDITILAISLEKEI